MVVLDTDLITLLERGNSASSANLRDRLLLVNNTNIATTVISYEEQMRGWMSYLSKAKNIAQQVDAYRRLSRHILYYNHIRVLPFDESAAVAYQRLRAAKVRVATMDLRNFELPRSQFRSALRFFPATCAIFL